MNVENKICLKEKNFDALHLIYNSINTDCSILFKFASEIYNLSAVRNEILGLHLKSFWNLKGIFYCPKSSFLVLAGPRKGSPEMS